MSETNIIIMDARLQKNPYPKLPFSFNHNMYPSVSRKDLSDISETKDKKEDETEQEENENLSITTHLYLKPCHTSDTLDKNVVLRRIRHRKRVNKVKSAVQGLFRCPFASNTNKTSNPQIKWADDAFAAL
ncbi:unnamed protein product [Fraxinus pennsylvanica]|uniref:Uncharacterized protein n=1 Tax=Fraxinus pennsylvanica TaxID=56036 RepID=A0AAD1Z7B0_9LAMI|nr:unnamed protein product [Fraxinus pennsylvanica]